jgi:acetoin utilization deacetylase AcuC-like enzyme
LDVALEAGTGDAVYLAALETGLQQALERARAELAIYLAGADPYEGDRLGTMKVTKTGLAERDRMVFDYCRMAGLPVVVTMAGGYAPNVDDIVDIHLQTVLLAAELEGISTRVK